jgi:hypothetical protein
MKIRIGICVLAVALSACASAGDRRDAAWETSRTQIQVQREGGRLSAAQAYSRLKQQYREIYGSDEGMAGYFAYAASIMTSAERGDIDAREAQMLVEAKELEALQEAFVLRSLREAYSYPEN